MLLSTFLLFGTFNSAHAIIIAIPVALGISFFQVLVVLSLFLFVPTAFFGGILRLLGYRHGSQGVWHLDFKLFVLNFSKYFIYHVLFFGIWFGIIMIITGQSHVILNSTNFSSSFPNSITAPFLSPGQAWFSLIYFLAWAIIAPYATYWWKVRRGNTVLKPGAGMHVRLLLWNMGVFYMAWYLISILYG